MLKDADRIFTNIYGWGDAGLTGARKRGDWSNTAKLIKLGHEGVWLARARRCRFSNRVEMVFHAQGSQGSPTLPCRQCR